LRLAAQSEHRLDETGVQSNGNYWNALGVAEKAGYLAGYADALNEVCIREKITVAARFPFGLRLGDIAKALDRFYDTPENVRIPIAGALLIFNARLVGWAEDTVQQVIVQLRVEASVGMAPAVPARAPQTEKQ